MDRILEAIFVEIKVNEKFYIIVGSIYKPPKHPSLAFTDQFTHFADLVSSALAELGSRNKSAFLYGDFNLDLLKFGENRFVTEYIETLFTCDFLQIVTRPTRLGDGSAALIDHILTNFVANEFECHILCSKISEHFPIIHILNNEKQIPQKLILLNPEIF